MDKEKQIFSQKLNYYMTKNNKTQSDLVLDLGINKSTISTWCNGTKMPRMGTIQTLADYFGIAKSDLIEEKPTAISDRHAEIIKLYEAASPELQAAALAMLEAAKAARLAQDQNNSTKEK